MTSEKNRFLVQLLMPMLLSAQFAPAAFAGDLPSLQKQEAAVDTQTAAEDAPAATPTLKGAVEKGDALGSASSTDAGTLQTQPASPADRAARREAALKKLALRAKLTSEDYRDLGIGVLGYDSDRTYFTQFAKITVLIPGCPAEKAGIRLGDLIIVDEEEAEDAGIKDPSIPTWVFSCGVEGQAVDLTIKRGDELLQFHLVRMNMEDVPDPHARHQYEQLVRQTGLSQGQVEINKPVSVPSTLRTLLGL
ncbi:MAG: hypothetical protein U0105_05375 [Candidatus Obscuribacterales bacterium]